VSVPLRRHTGPVPAAETWWCRTSRDVATVHGPDAAAYLQSQLSQDIAGMGIGDACWAFLLGPDGKVEVLVRVAPTADDTFLLDVDAGYGDALATRLRRFLIRTKAEVESRSWPCSAVRGPHAAAVRTDGTVHALASWWGHGDAIDLLGPEPVAPPGMAEVGAAELEAARVASGWPAMGLEIRPGEAIPAETGLVDVAVSFTKGCYPGQELVERMHARNAQPPRSLRRLQAELPLTAGADVERDGRTVGTVTSVCGPLGLALIARAVEPGDTVVAGGRPATVHALRSG
jgi:tRNA-modifying protein YgfZ